MRLGILGGGQLGRMIALAAHPLGVRSTVLEPGAEACAAHVCDHIRGEFDDLQALYRLAQASDVITYEFENVPVESARWLAERVPVFPPPRALEVSQDRIIEKQFFESLGLPGVLAYATIAAELGGGAMLVLGVYTRAVAFALVPVLIGATWAHVGNGWSFSAPKGGWEYPAFLTLAAVVAGLLGDGRYSLMTSIARSPGVAPRLQRAA